MPKGVMVEYIGNKKDYKYRGHSFPCKMSAQTAKALIERNPRTFKCVELEAPEVEEELSSDASMSDAGEEANTDPQDEE